MHISENAKGPTAYTVGAFYNAQCYAGDDAEMLYHYENTFLHSVHTLQFTYKLEFITI